MERAFGSDADAHAGRTDNPVMRRADMGDTVRIASTPDTIAGGYADRTGSCHGFTTSSVTGVEVVAATGEDIALNVAFEDGTDGWFDPSVVVIVGDGPLATAQVGDQRFVRDRAGEWRAVSDSD